MKSLVSVFLWCIAFSIYGQINMSDINLNRVPYKKVRSFMQSQMESGISTVSELKASYPKNEIPDSLTKCSITYSLSEPIMEVWRAYSHVEPKNAWNGNMVRMGLLVDKAIQEVIYPEQDCGNLDTGQVIFLNLKLLLGVSNVAVAFEIINIDANQQMIEFSYVNGNASIGKQQLLFSEMEGGGTQVIHHAYFQSTSKFRDKYLYPYFHKRATNEFHRNMRKVVRERVGNIQKLVSN